MSNSSTFLKNAFQHLPGGGYRVDVHETPDDEFGQDMNELYTTPLDQYMKQTYENNPTMLAGIMQQHSERRLSESTLHFHHHIDSILEHLHIDSAIPTQLNRAFDTLKRQPTTSLSKLQLIQRKAAIHWLQEIAAEVWTTLESEGYSLQDFAG